MAFDDGVKTVSGSVASVLDGAEKVPVESCVLSLDASLTGYSQATLKHTGKNMLNPTTCQRGYITANGSIAAPLAAQQELYSDYIKVKPNTTYTFSATVNNSSEKWRGFAYYDKDKNFISRYAAVAGNVEHFSVTNKTPATSMYIRCTWRNYSDISSGGSVCPCQLEEGSETSYEEFSIDNKTADLSMTIYGGQVDIVNGTGKPYGYVDLGSFTWVKVTSGQAPYFSTTSALNPAYKFINKNPNAICEYPQASIGSTGTVNGFYIIDSGYLRIRDDDTENMTADEFKTYVTGKKLAYELVSPTDFTFTPVSPTPETEERCHFWHESGDISVTYHDNAHGFASVTVIKTTRNLFDDKHLNVGLPGASIGSYIDTINTTATRYTYNGFVPPHGNVVIKGSRNDADVVAACLFFGYKNGYLTEYRSINPYGNSAVVVDCSAFDYVRLSVGAKSGYQAPTDMTEYGYVQAEAGSVIHDYEPYVAPVSKTAYLHKVIYGGKADVIRGTCEAKNLLKLYLARTSNLGVNFSLTDEGLLHMEGTNTSSTGSAFSGGNYNTYDACPWKFPAGTYTASSLITADNNKVGSVNLLIRTKTDNTQYSYYLKDSSKTFTVNEDFGAWFWASVLKTETVNCDVGVQLEKGSTASDFAPYFEPFTFPPISMSTDEGENTLFANEGDSAITYRKETD